MELVCKQSLPEKWNDEKIDVFKAILDEPLPFPEENYYIKDPKMPSEIEKIRIPAGKTLIITNELKEGDVLEWWVMGDANFSMGVFFADDKNEENIEK